MEKKKHGKKKVNPLFLTVGIMLLIHGITLLFPFYWMMTTSFKGILEYRDSFVGWPQDFWQGVENYKRAFKLIQVKVYKADGPYVVDVWGLLGNSLTLAVFKSFFTLLPTVLTSYAVAKYDFGLRKTLFNINIFVMTIPIVGSLATTLTVYKQLNIYNNLWPYMIFPHHPFGFNFLLLYGAFKAIPNSYSEAVMIDGGGHFTIFFKIILPTILPTLTALYVLAFIGNWNDYNSTLLYVRKVPTLAYGLYEFHTGVKANVMSLPEILAGFAMCSIPSVTLYCAFQPLIGKSLAMGGLKE